MNQDNYGSLGACQRLVEAGIEINTEFHYCQKSDNEPIQLIYHADSYVYQVFIPAPSMAEVWRELPAGVRMIHRGGNVQVYPEYDSEHMSYGANPTDALIDLLIWLKEQKNEAKRDRDT